MERAQSAHSWYFHRVLERVSDAVVTTDAHGRVAFANPAAERLYGVSEPDAIGRALADLLAGFDAGDDGDLDNVTLLVARDGEWHGEIAQRTLDGRDLVVEASISLLRDDDGRVVGSAAVVRDVSARKAVEQRLAHQASHDSLTGLLNRTAFLFELTNAMEAADGVITVVFADLNGFKQINDLWGHERGDEVLRAVAGRLAGTLRPGDPVGRLGGDEFVVLARGLYPEAVKSLVDRITGLFVDPVRTRAGTCHQVGLSIGVATARPQDTPDDVLRRADTAMYEAKRSTEVTSAYCIAR